VQATNGQRGVAEGISNTQEDSAGTGRRGFPRILKAGYAIKLGAVVSARPVRHRVMYVFVCSYVVLVSFV